MNPGDSATRQEVRLGGPPTRTRWGGYHLARPGGRPGPKGVWYPQHQTSNLKPIAQGASNLHCDEDMEDKIKLLDLLVQTLMRTYLEVFGELPPPATCDKLVQMDLKLKTEFVGHKIRRRPYSAPKEQADEIERQIQECIDAGLVLEYKDGDYPQHCSPCFLVAKHLYSQTAGSGLRRAGQENSEPLRVHS